MTKIVTQIVKRTHLQVRRTHKILRVRIHCVQVEEHEDNNQYFRAEVKPKVEEELEESDRDTDGETKHAGTLDVSLINC